MSETASHENHSADSERSSLHFIEQIVVDDLSTGKHDRIHTRFRRNRTDTFTSDTPRPSA